MAGLDASALRRLEAVKDTMSSASLARRQKKTTPFPQIAKAPEPEPEPKPDGLPAHPFAIEAMTIYRRKTVKIELPATPTYPDGKIVSGEIVRSLDSFACRAWARYGLENEAPG